MDKYLACMVELSGLPKGTKCLAPLKRMGNCFPIRQGSKACWYQRYVCELRHTILFQVWSEDL